MTTTRLRTCAVDIGPTLVLAVVATHALSYNHAPAWQWCTSLVAVAALAVRRQQPLLVLAIALGCCSIEWSRGVLQASPLSVRVALHAVAWLRPRRTAVAAAVVTEVAVVWVALRFSPTGSVNDGVVILSTMLVASVLLGTSQRDQGLALTALREQAEELRAERHRSAVLAAEQERTRIAREMHDIVAHSVSVMIALSDGASRTTDPSRTKELTQQVAATGRQALTELRRVLHLLRDRDPDAPDGRADPDAIGESRRAPQPSMRALPSLVADVERAGLAVSLTMDGPSSGSLSEGLESAVYRIVQESLTNSLKYARDATRADVRIQVAPDTVDVLVTDDGAATTQSGPGGQGLRGIRERARLYGGGVTAGPQPSGGWMVHCVLDRREDR